MKFAKRKKPVAFVQICPEFRVRDIETVIAFYTESIGFEVALRQEVEIKGQVRGFALLRRDTAELSLVESDEVFSHGAFLYVRNIETLYERCQEHKVEIVRGLESHAYGLKDFVVRDPAGNQIGIGERIA